MILVKLMGGLGNQMFQYAVARNLSIKFNRKLYLDISSYELDKEYTNREFELSNFNINAEIVNKNALKSFYGNSFSVFNKILLYLLTLGKFKKINIPLSDTKLHTFKDSSLYLRGFFQNENYFIENKQQILSDFSLKNIPDNKYSKSIAGNINSVSIHIRRGDYVKNKLAIDVLGAKEISYYINAIFFIKNTLLNNDVHFYIFSDDIEWCKNNLIFEGNKTFVDDINNTIDEFYLMSICKHNIISNSTFSWWAAYLNSNKSKIVVAPEVWFRNNKYENNKIVPENWIKL